MKRFAQLVGLCAIAMVMALSPPAGAVSGGDAGSPPRAKKEGAQKKDEPQQPSAPAAGKKGHVRKRDAQKEAPKKDEPAKTAAKGAATGTDKSAAKAPAAKEPAAKETDNKPAAAKDAGKGADDKPTTYKLKKKLLKIEATLDGVFEAQNRSEVAVHMEEWNDLEVVKAIEHGSNVRPGDLLLALDTEKIDRMIADLQRDQALSRLTLQEADLQVQTLRATLPLDLASSERTRRVGQEDQEYFLKTERPWNEKAINFMVKMAEDYLSYEQEELRQLEKMYKADDLVEETEEIILKRARDQVDRAKFSVERMKLERDSMLKMTLPRSEELLKLNTQRQAIDWQKAQIIVPAALRKAELALEKAKIDGGRSEEKLKKLLADREHMTLKSSLSGVVYYGRCVRGKWSSTEMLAEKLRRGGRLTNDDVVMTVVEPRPLRVRTTLTEKQLAQITPGLKGYAQPASYPDAKLTAIIERVSPVPLSTREFETTITVAPDDAAAAGLMPGMTCEVHLVTYLKPGALCVPLAAVGTDDADPHKSYVCLPGKEGQHPRRDVTLGKRAEKQVEILSGLAEGEEILAECPKE